MDDKEQARRTRVAEAKAEADERKTRIADRLGCAVFVALAILGAVLAGQVWLG